jgi:hypothetical protein
MHWATCRVVSVFLHGILDSCTYALVVNVAAELSAAAGVTEESLRDTVETSSRVTGAAVQAGANSADL